MSYRALGRRAEIWSEVDSQVWGPPAGLVAHVCQPTSLKKLVGSGSSAVFLYAFQTLSQSESGKEKEEKSSKESKDEEDMRVTKPLK